MSPPSGAVPRPPPFIRISLPSGPLSTFTTPRARSCPPGSVVDVTGDLTIQEDGGLTVLTEMEPLGELTISTHGQGPLVSGSVRVVSEGPLGGDAAL